jgi:hypothetical protein
MEKIKFCDQKEPEISSPKQRFLAQHCELCKQHNDNSLSTDYMNASYDIFFSYLWKSIIKNHGVEMRQNHQFPVSVNISLFAFTETPIITSQNKKFLASYGI